MYNKNNSILYYNKNNNIYKTSDNIFNINIFVL